MGDADRAVADVLRGTDLLDDPRGARNASALLGAVLIGAMLGGFCEYVGMAIGHDALTLVAIVAYLGSLLLLLRARRAPLLS